MLTENKQKVNTKREQRQKMIILSSSMLRDLLEDEKEGHFFTNKMKLNNKYKHLLTDKKQVKRKKDKLKLIEQKQFEKVYNRHIDHANALAESFIAQNETLEQKIAEIGYDVMDEKFPIKCN